MNHCAQIQRICRSESGLATVGEVQKQYLESTLRDRTPIRDCLREELVFISNERLDDLTNDFTNEMGFCYLQE
jgi:hypothetical protein